MAAQDIFNRRPLDFKGAFAADSAAINVNFGACSDAGTGLLIQQLQIQYQQPITRLYEVGTQFTYYVAGRPQGSCNIARILGPGAVFAEFYSCLGDVCNADANDLCFCVSAGCTADFTGEQGMNLCVKNVVLQSLGFSVQAQDMIINEQLSLFFTALLATGAACTPSAVADVKCGCGDF